VGGRQSAFGDLVFAMMPKNFFEKLIKTASDKYEADIVVYIGQTCRFYSGQFKSLGLRC
jgi:hypothetical protein